MFAVDQMSVAIPVGAIVDMAPSFLKPIPPLCPLAVFPSQEPEKPTITKPSDVAIVMVEPVTQLFAQVDPVYAVGVGIVELLLWTPLIPPATIVKELIVTPLVKVFAPVNVCVEASTAPPAVLGRLVKAEPSTAGSLVSPSSRTSCPAPLKALPWSVTLEDLALNVVPVSARETPSAR